MYDTIIIGGGPAGISASLYILRAGFSAAVIAKDSGTLAKVEKIENYYGLPSMVTGEELHKTGLAQLERFGGELIPEEVVAVSWNAHFTVKTTTGAYEARSVIFATGSQRKTLKIENLDKLEGSGVSYCAVCDAFFFRGKNVAVLGNSRYALHEAEVLSDVAKKVTILTNSAPAETDFPPEMTVDARKITSLLGENKFTGVRFADGEEADFDGLFIALGTAGSADFAREIGLMVEGGKIKVDEGMKASFPGAFAAGDCIGGTLQIATAVGEGARAGLSAVEFLRSQK